MTLIEVMVALGLSAFVMAGVIQIFLSGQQSYRLQKGLGLVQDNGRMAVYFLQRGLRMAGFPTEVEPGTPPRLAAVNRFDQSLPFIQQFSAFEFNNDVSGTAATRDGVANNGSDFVTVSYLSATNCLGRATSAYPAAQLMPGAALGAFYTRDQYYIDTSVAGPQSARNPLSLRCRALGLNNIQVGTSASLVDGIEDFQVLYGVDAFNETSGAVTIPGNEFNRDDKSDALINATAVLNRGLQRNIVTARFAVLATSLDNALDTPSGQQHRLLDAPALPAFNDRILRRVFTSTVAIRNAVRTQTVVPAPTPAPAP